MQRLTSSRRLLQAALAPGRAHSGLSAAAVAAAPENGVAAPKMPPFDYTPPPPIPTSLACLCLHPILKPLWILRQTLGMNFSFIFT